MRAVWKFPIDVSTVGGTVSPEITMPAGAKIVHVAQQRVGDVVTLWAEVNPDARVRETRYFAIIGTGHPIPDGYEHVGTWLDDPFVWHLYELTS